ncbi:tail assembly chaperone [Salimicrobium jeotgali]|uniref:tail assembly chaperone n=1 Tax=Salimicrobium jeotgali TaxID=1230341 RepID=UPI000C838AF5|nr:tail assembly chaperone [Salimicrobium jeotgali]
MAIYLTIKDEEIEGKGSFKAVYHADEHYSIKDEKGNKQAEGIAVIYEGILRKDPVALVHLWDCLLAGKNKRPNKSTIEDALAEASNDGEDFEPLFQDGVQILEGSGFFKEKVTEMWNQMEQAKEFMKDEDKAMVDMQYKQLNEARKELNRQKK